MIGNIRLRLVLAWLVAALLGPAPSHAQQLEPRRWSHLPVGAQFLGLGYVYTDGEVFFDPVLRIEDTEMRLDSFGAHYIYSFGLDGRSARLDVGMPYQKGRWEGYLDGEFTVVEREGLADPRLRLSVLLYGAPALAGEAFGEFTRSHSVNTVVGAAVALKLPFGEYDRERLINLGRNRFVLRPELGVLHTRHKWSYELTGSVGLFEDNDEFWPGGSEREQDPLFLVQGHVVHTFRPGLWASASGGYGFGGESSINGVAKNDQHDNYFWAVTLGIPLSPSQGIKLAYAEARRNTLVGVSSNNLAVAWSILF